VTLRFVTKYVTKAVTAAANTAPHTAAMAVTAATSLFDNIPPRPYIGAAVEDAVEGSGPATGTTLST
jgi:hypothetical protein